MSPTGEPGEVNIGTIGVPGPCEPNEDLTRAPEKEPGWYPAEVAHRKIEHIYWYSTLLLTLLVAIGAGVSAFYAFRAADISRRNFVATTRAWVDIPKPFAQLSLQWKEGYALISVAVGAVNKGNSPALEISPAATVITNLNETVDQSAMLKYCPQAGDVPGWALFPNDDRVT